MRTEEIIFTSGDVRLAGTLTLPDSKGRHPAVILISGSGPLNRDEEVFGFRPFRIMADHFAHQGIATLRCDSRGVGGSSGNVSSSTFPDLEQDVMAGIAYLGNRDEIRPSQIGLCGHSEGGRIAPLCASNSDEVAFIILMSGAGHPGKDIFLAQSELFMKADGTADGTVNAVLRCQERLLSLILEGAMNATLESVLIEIEGIKSSDQLAPEGDSENTVKKKVAAQLAKLNTPAFKYYLNDDPIPKLEKVRCPTLLLFGGLDLQVSPSLNKDVMEAALRRGGNERCTSRVFPQANHLFQRAKSGSLAEYGSLDRKLVPGFLEFMSDWVLRNVDAAT